MLIVSGEQYSCREAVMNTEYDDGRTGFIFINAREGGGIISFSGMGQEQVSPSVDLRLQPVDALVVDGTRKRAVGFCAFGNPFSGQARMECYAYLENGELYAGFFLSDGQTPKLMGPGNLNELGATE